MNDQTDQPTLSQQLETLSSALRVPPSDASTSPHEPTLVGRILYRSRSLMSPSDHAELLVQCHRNNRRLGLTGLLLIQGDQITQVLEGPAPVLTAVLGRIETDHRHTAFKILDQQTGVTRLFPQWAMGSYALSEQGLAALIDDISSSTDAERQALAGMIRAGA